MNNKDFHNNYLVQKHINLATVGGSPFDIRVVTQKNSQGQWGIGGAECRIAEAESLVTNISRGGYAMKLNETLSLAFGRQAVPSLTKEIFDLSLNLSIHLDSFQEHFAEFGIDIGIDMEQNLWIIEPNVRPSFNGFKDIEYRTYRKLSGETLLYALSLTKFGAGEF
jgi:glutathione synthase/RimK-type ligase-like ATP-grasp enzyme